MNITAIILTVVVGGVGILIDFSLEFPEKNSK